MRTNIYINGIGAVSPQGVWRSDLFSEAQPLSDAINLAEQPSYKEFIAPAMIRRMSKGIKMSIYAAQQALDEADISVPDAIITGTGLGCSGDSEKFLRGILDNDEQFLTPTSFIQSTHNTVAAQIALRLDCKGYNFTYVHRSVSFESALLDAFMQLEASEAENVLIGGVDEVSEHTYRLLQLLGYIKENDQHETVKNNTSRGVNYGEGASFFCLSSQQTPSSYAQVVDVELQNNIAKADLSVVINTFLKTNGLGCEDIDAVILGLNGDLEYDHLYEEFQSTFSSRPTLYYKHLTGQFDSASAFGLATAAFILKGQTIPSVLDWNNVPGLKGLTNVLLYNQYRGSDHSLILIRAC